MVSAVGDATFSASSLTLHNLFLSLPYTPLLCLPGPPVPPAISLFHSQQNLIPFLPPFALTSLLIRTQKAQTSLHVGH